MMITAHSGCEGTRPDSLSSIETGIALGADAVEIDVRRDKTGRLVLSHDKENATQSAMSLENAFAVIAPSRVSVNCDLKEYDILPDVLDMASRFGIGRDRLIFSGSVSAEYLEKHPDIADRARIFLNIEEITPYCPYADCAKRAKELGAASLNLPYARTSLEDARHFGETLPLSMWTVDDEEALCVWGELPFVCNITAKKAAQAIAALRR